MTDHQHEAESDRPESPREGGGSGEGVELTMGEPNTFEPEAAPGPDRDA